MRRSGPNVDYPILHGPYPSSSDTSRQRRGEPWREDYDDWKQSDRDRVSYDIHGLEQNPTRRHAREQGQRTPDYRGIGPKGYQRAPDRILDDVCGILTRAWHVDPSDVEIDVDEKGVVTLRGEVTSREQKRQIEACCDLVMGVRDVRNRLEIRSNAKPTCAVSGAPL